MPQRPNELKPWESPEALFGSELRHYREAARMSCDQLAKMIPFSKSTISATERGESVCDRRLAQTADEVLDTRGALTRMWDALFKNNGAVPRWFSDWYMQEPEATHIRSYQPLVIDGLFQTPDYARALLGGNEPKVEARIARQAILTRTDPPPPNILCVLDESVLYRDIGGAAVMREQLNSLVENSSPQLRVQIVPSIQHGGLSGAFVIGTLPDGDEIAYREGVLRGDTTTEREVISRLTEQFGLIHSHAYPLNQSLEIIKEVAKSKWS